MAVKLLSGGSLIATVRTSARGKYRLADLAPGACILKPRKAGFYFRPGKRSITITATDMARQNFRAYPR